MILLRLIALCFIAFMSCAAQAGTLAQTGVDFCTDGEKRIDCPQPGEPFFGQDGNYLAGEPRSYTKLDGSGAELPYSAQKWSMVKDNITGLIWEVKTEENCKDTYDWSDAYDYCRRLELGGFLDWRLPEIKELLTLVDSGRDQRPAININFFENCNHGDWSFYWSNSLSSPVYFSKSYRGIFFSRGRLDTRDSDQHFFVRAVRDARDK